MCLVIFQAPSTDGTKDASTDSKDGDILTMAIQAADIGMPLGPSPDHLMASLRREEAKSRQLKRLLQNQYSKMSRHLKYHNQTVVGFQAEVEKLKKNNATLLTEKKTLEETIEQNFFEMVSQTKAMHSATMDANFYKILLSSRDKLVEQLTNEKKNF